MFTRTRPAGRRLNRMPTQPAPRLMDPAWTAGHLPARVPADVDVVAAAEHATRTAATDPATTARTILAECARGLDLNHPADLATFTDVVTTRTSCVRLDVLHAWAAALDADELGPARADVLAALVATAKENAR